MKKSWLAAAGLASLWAIPAALLAPWFPTVFIDEAENANHAYNLAFHHVSVFTLYDQLYPPTLGMLRQSWPVVIRPFFVAPLALYLRLVGFGLVRARLYDVGLGALCMGLIYLVGGRAISRRGGQWAAGLLGTRFAFLYSTHTIRPEATLCLAGIAMIGCLWNGLDSGAPAWLIPAGLVAGLAGGIHTNGIWFAVPCFALPLLEKRWRALAWILAGYILGLAAFIHFADWERFLPGVQSLFFKEFSTPPIMALHGNILAAIAEEFDRYQGQWIFAQWKSGEFFPMLAGWQLLLYAAGVTWAFTQKDSTKRFAWTASLLAMAYALGVGQKAYNYTTALEPFFILAVAAWFAHSTIDAEWAFIGGAIALAFFPFGLLPLVILPAFFLLDRRVARVALLIFLLCLFTRILLLRGNAILAIASLRRVWPLMAIGLIGLVVGAKRLRGRKVEPASIAMGLAAVITAGSLFFVGAVASYRPNFRALSRQMAALMVPASRVAGPQGFWLGLSTYDYRDIGGLMWYRLLLGQKDWLTPLEEFHPRYLIIDPGFASRLRRFNADLGAKGLQGPTGLFPWPHRVLGVWSTGPAYDENLALIELLWPSPLHDKK